MDEKTAKFLMKSIERDPRDRYQTAADFREGVEARACQGTISRTNARKRPSKGEGMGTFPAAFEFWIYLAWIPHSLIPHSALGLFLLNLRQRRERRPLDIFEKRAAARGDVFHPLRQAEVLDRLGRFAAADDGDAA